MPYFVLLNKSLNH